jgi:hypothetical protein
MPSVIGAFRADPRLDHRTAAPCPTFRWDGGDGMTPSAEALRKIAFDERAEIHDLVMQGIEAVLRKRGYVR